jgi:hypothetical protein
MKPISGNVVTKGIGKKSFNKMNEQKGKERKEKKSRHVEHTLNYPNKDNSLEEC